MAALSHPPTTAADRPPPHTRKEPPQQKHSSLPNHNPHRSPRSSASERSPDLTPSHHHSSHRHNHTSTPSTGSLSSKTQRSSNSLLTRAAAALDRTQSAIASLSDPVIRPRQSNSALARLSLVPSSLPTSEPASPDNKSTTFNSSPSSQSLASSSKVDSRQSAHAAPAKDPPSQPYSETDPGHPAPVRLPGPDSKMHQTSSRLLRMTDDDRPFTRVCDLFSGGLLRAGLQDLWLCSP